MVNSSCIYSFYGIVKGMESLPQSHINDHFGTVEACVIAKWRELINPSELPRYEPNKSDEAILNEYEELDQHRRRLFDFDPFFNVSTSHLENKQYRFPECLTFSHSATCPSYNSTSITSSGQRFFALEGPQKHHLENFVSLLTRWDVRHLVCLTDSCEGEEDKCHPYWESHVTPFEFWPEWLDGTGAPPEQLIAKAQRLKEHAEDRIIAVHCSAGVGRTGTFISTLSLLNQIDNPNLSIYELVLYLNFHRPWMVGCAEQYLSVYRVADLLRNA